jgi:dTDP-4-dehydrorhamnose 3,5-epimerase
VIIADTVLAGVKVITPRIFDDHRGHFFVSYHNAEFEESITEKPFVQDNCSRSRQGVLRGLHYQVCCPQGKLVRVTAGEIFDVVVDIRPDSPTLGRYVGVMLSSENKQALWIPPGFAHGFLTISSTAEVMYKVTEYWDPASERTLMYNDSGVSIDWPMENLAHGLILSDKDLAGFSLDAAVDEIHEIQRKA